ncbi:hypothetical protein FACS1894111_01600 [Clostridia bacterium]|nr:hypothetical protein FACS1894111_01600 [Clostridia bacterium]
MSESEEYKNWLEKNLCEFINENEEISNKAVESFRTKNHLGDPRVQMFGYRQYCPPKLYKYRAFDKYWVHWIGGNIRLNHPNKWNDLSDSLCTVPKETDKNEDAEKLREMYRKNRTACCFSESYSNMPMWSFYSREHTGFVVEYNFRDLPGNGRKHYPFFIQPIIYNDIKFPVDLLCKYLSEDKHRVILPPYPLLVKSKEWAYEQEWRMIGEVINHKDELHCDLVNEYPDAKEYVKGIYFGIKTDEAIIEKAKELLESYYPEKMPDLYKMEMNPYENKLRCTPL